MGMLISWCYGALGWGRMDDTQILYCVTMEMDPLRIAPLETGLGDAHYPTQTASWGDYDNDGDLDLYIGNESSQAFSAPCQLFENNGDGSFTDVAGRARVQNHRLAKSVIWGDYNNDRLPDLYVSNLKKGNRLYRNNGDGTFTDEAKRLDVQSPPTQFPLMVLGF